MRKYLVWLYRDLTPWRRASSLFALLSFVLWDVLCGRDHEQVIWLIGEARGDCLLENGYHFFRYCRRQHPEQLVFFVVRPSSPYFSKLQDDPRVLRYGSWKHVRIFRKTKVCFYTHTYSDIIYREQYLACHKGKKLVYLHHGVLGFKKFDERYVADRNLMDVFIVGSTLERDILISKVGVMADKVKVTGYARYDAMVDSSVGGNPQIAYIPTHRNRPQVSPEEFRKSDFFRNVDRFINDSELHAFLALSRITLKVYLHAVMREYSSQLASDSPWVEVLAFGDVGPQRLICESQLLITDYSSVAWDFFYLGKPVLFYRFDIAEYLALRDSYLPLDKPLFGDVLFEAGEVVTALIESRKTKFALADKYKVYRDSIMPVLDHRNCERIYAEASRFMN